MDPQYGLLAEHLPGEELRWIIHHQELSCSPGSMHTWARELFVSEKPLTQSLLGCTHSRIYRAN